MTDFPSVTISLNPEEVYLIKKGLELISRENNLKKYKGYKHLVREKAWDLGYKIGQYLSVPVYLTPDIKAQMERDYGVKPAYYSFTKKGE